MAKRPPRVDPAELEAETFLEAASRSSGGSSNPNVAPSSDVPQIDILTQDQLKQLEKIAGSNPQRGGVHSLQAQKILDDLQARGIIGYQTSEEWKEGWPLNEKTKLYENRNRGMEVIPPVLKLSPAQQKELDHFKKLVEAGSLDEREVEWLKHQFTPRPQPSAYLADFIKDATEARLPPILPPEPVPESADLGKAKRTEPTKLLDPKLTGKPKEVQKRLPPSTPADLRFMAKPVPTRDVETTPIPSKPQVAKVGREFVEGFREFAEESGFRADEFFKSPVARANKWKQWDDVPADAQSKVTEWGELRAGSRQARNNVRVTEEVIQGQQAARAKDPFLEARQRLDALMRKKNRATIPMGKEHPATWDELKRFDFRGDVSLRAMVQGAGWGYDKAGRWLGTPEQLKAATDAGKPKVTPSVMRIHKGQPLWTPVMEQKAAELMALNGALGEKAAEPGANFGRPPTTLATKLEEFSAEFRDALDSDDPQQIKRVIQKAEILHKDVFTSGGRPRGKLFSFGAERLVRRQRQLEAALEARGRPLGAAMDPKEIRRLRPLLTQIKAVAGITGMKQRRWEMQPSGRMGWTVKELNRQQVLEEVKKVIEDAGIATKTDLLPKVVEEGFAKRQKTQIGYLAQLREEDIPKIQDYIAQKMDENRGLTTPGEFSKDTRTRSRRRQVDPVTGERLPAEPIVPKPKTITTTAAKKGLTVDKFKDLLAKLARSIK